MRIKLLAGMSSSAFCLVPGDEAEFADDEALRLIEAGFAVPAKPKVERATKRAPETRKKGR